MNDAPLLRRSLPPISGSGRVAADRAPERLPNSLILRAESWPGRNQHGSVGLSLQTASTAPDSSEQP